MANRITYSSICLKVTSAEGGDAPFSLKIPGVFDGNIFLVSSGRYFRSASIWSKNGVDGDLLKNLRIEDEDRVIAAANGNLSDVQMRALGFPAYPIMLRFYDHQVTESNGLVAGIFIPANRDVSITPIDRTIEFIPSGLYFKGDFKAASGGSGVEFYMNIAWGSSQVMGA